MAQFPKFHGITMANNSWVENLYVERLEADPIPVQPGRIWFNVTSKQLKYSTLDAGGAVVVFSHVVAADVAAALDDAKAYADQKISALIDGAPALLDTLNELAAALGDDANFVTTVTY